MKPALRWTGFALAVGFLGLTVVNASWMAPAPLGSVGLIARHGAGQIVQDAGEGQGDCSARHIETPQHRFIGNTLPSAREARQLGAAMIEVDIAPTRDGKLAVFQDLELGCRTDGEGPVREHTMAQLKALDAGYGYTADGGETHPLRGTGVGAIPTLAQFARAANPKQLLYHFEGENPADADMLAAALKAMDRDPVAKGDAFYAAAEAGPIARIREIYPEAWVFSARSAAACTDDYALQGWIGMTPESCRGGTMVIPLDRQWMLAGWPNRLLARMEAVGAHVIVTGPQDEAPGFDGLDLPEQLGEIPSTFNGYVWVDDIWNLGPALFPSVDVRSAAERKAGDTAIARRRAAR